MWLDGGEKGGDGVGDAEKLYFWWPGPTLMGRGDGGVGGDDEGEAYPFFTISSNEIVISLLSKSLSLSLSSCLCFGKALLGKKCFPGRSFFFFEF